MAAALFSTMLTAVAQTPIERRIESARQLQTGSRAPAATRSSDLGENETLTDDDWDPTEMSFGTMQLMKETPRERNWTGFADIAVLVTNNAALTRIGEVRDTFMNYSAGVAYQKNFGGATQFDVVLRGGVYRYRELRELDFQSIDFSVGVSRALPWVSNASVFARYGFNGLASRANRDDLFFENHTLSVGVQKVFPFSPAHYAFVGISAQGASALPRPAERHELAAYAGLNVQATRHLAFDLNYRYSYYTFPNAQGRRDQNHTLALAARYQVATHFFINATGFLGYNDSNQRFFDYRVLNAGAGVSGNYQF